MYLFNWLLPLTANSATVCQLTLFLLKNSFSFLIFLVVHPETIIFFHWESFPEAEPKLVLVTFHPLSKAKETFLS
jgi:hypothetical protein